MIDLEISKALALAIGWRSDDMKSFDDAGLWIYGSAAFVWHGEAAWRKFDYRDPAVIWPIAERYSAFPSSLVDGNFRKAKARNRERIIGWEVLVCDYKNSTEYNAKWLRFPADTAAKAVALAVIGTQK